MPTPCATVDGVRIDAVLNLNPSLLHWRGVRRRGAIRVQLLDFARRLPQLPDLLSPDTRLHLQRGKYV